MTDKTVKLELLKLTVELTKFAIEKGAYSAVVTKKSFSEAFKDCDALVKDAYKDLEGSKDQTGE